MGWTFDSGFCLKENIGSGGLEKEDLNSAAAALKKSLKKIKEGREKGEFGFLKLPHLQICAERSRDWAKATRDEFDDFVLLGIGGSALGPRAIVDVLRHPLHNHLPRSERFGKRVFVCDNVDPLKLAAILDVVDLEKTVFNVVSKSGSTAEALAPFMIVHRLLTEKIGQAAPSKQIILTTDPENGELRRLVNEEGYVSFEIPPSVGGRYSVMSNVGLLTAAAAGVDPVELLHGAAWAEESCLSEDFEENPAALIAALAYTFHKEKNRNILVMMPYHSGLLTFAEWFQQLWAESLGKKKDIDGNDVHAGATPVRALGSTDQHSQLQLYMEGPQDKFIIFIKVENPGVKLQIPSIYTDRESLSYLGGHTLGELMRAEQAATAAALAKNGRPNLTITLDRMDTRTLGALFQLFEIATVLAGDLYRVNPFDQPGVELGKKLTYGMMGRKGFEPENVEPEHTWRFRQE